MRRTKRVLLAGLILLGAMLAFMIPQYYATFEKPVRTRCEKATREFGGDCVEAMLELLQSTDHAFQEKNEAVWTLARLGDERALPVLQQLYTGEHGQGPCRRHQELCQYELEKAIRFCSESNLGTFLIRLRVAP